MSDEAALREWVQHQQMLMWTDLDSAIRHAINGRWSIESANIAARVAAAARLVGLTPYEELPWSLLAGGVYEALAQVIGITPALPTEAEWERLDRVMAGHGGPRAALRSRLAQTVAALRDDGPYIRDEAA